MIVLKAAQEKFLTACGRLGIVERRHTLPILANVLIRRPSFDRSDDERPRIQVRPPPTRRHGSNFATTVGARKLIDILRRSPRQTVP